jgi:hypothetical protein
MGDSRVTHDARQVAHTAFQALCNTITLFGDGIMSHVLAKTITALLVVGVAGVTSNASYAADANLDCKLHFSLNS